MWESRPAVQAAVPDQPTPEPEPVAPPEPEFLELVVPADAVIGLQLESTVSSDRAKVEDAVDARVTRDVRVGGRVAIPAGSLVHGTVTEVERGGKVRERARLGIRFHTVVLATGDRLTLRTDAITREGAAPGRESAAKIGGAAVGGAILGAILGGGKGAAIGGAVGAGSGTAAVMAGERNIVTVPAGSTVSVRIQQPVTVTVEKE
jgi:type IV secretory pathway VirB10-like protein